MNAQIYNYKAWLLFKDDARLVETIDGILQESGFTIINFMEHHFKPVGYTSIWLLGESHAAIHTFPEESKVYVEVSSCVHQYLLTFINRFENRYDGNLLKVNN